MLNQERVKRLSKEQKQKLDKLTKEYEEASKATRTRRLHGADAEVMNRYHVATKHLADFLTLHNLNSTY